MISRTGWRIRATLLLLILSLATIALTVNRTDTYASESFAKVANEPFTNVSGGNWSDPSTWSKGRIPRQGDRVEIIAGTRVEYDVISKEEIASLDILGELTFSHRVSTNLDVGTVTVLQSGKLEVGSEKEPIPDGVKATIRIVNKNEDGENSIDVFGEAQFHGQPMQYVYTRLAQDAYPGAKTITVQDPVGWKRGDFVIITSTTTRPKDTERNRVARVNGNVITLRKPLRQWHSGVSPTQAEVANLTRNVLITSKNPELRGHTRYLSGAKGSISYAEFARLGARGKLGKYPIHFHMVGDTMRGAFVRGVSVHDSGNRFITIHSSQYITLSKNVGYNAVGHGYFLEIGDEAYNTLEGNLGVLVKPGDILRDDSKPAVFWVQNPLNTLVDNIAVSSVGGNGFHYRLRAKVMDIGPPGIQVRPTRAKVLRFEGNEAHSNSKSGLRVYLLNPQDKDQASVFTNVKLWRNGKIGAWMKAHHATLSNSVIFGNGEVNLALKGNGITIENTRLAGTLGDAPEAARANIPITPRGLVIHGKNNSLVDSVLEGHVGNDQVGGADVSFYQDQEGPSTLTITGTLTKSDQPVIFGYPINGKSFIRVEGFQGDRDNDLLLFRFDESPPEPCDYEFDLRFMANVCR